MTAREKITKARAGLILDQPFFGALALRLKVIEDPTARTAWTDGQVIGFNPPFIDGLTLDETKGLLAHEVMHLACSHHARRGARDSKKWNMAGDFAINGIIRKSFTIPAGGLYSRGLDGLGAEDIYSKLPEPDPDGGADPGGSGEVRDAPGPPGPDDQPGPASQPELNRAAQDWRIAVSQAAQVAKAMGTLPAGLDRLVENIVNPKLDWRVILRRFIENTAKNDYTWTPPNRRHIHNGLILPSLRSQEFRPLAVAVDTSGSIGARALDQFAAELTAIMEETRAEVTIIYCDSEVNGIETVRPEDLPITFKPKGGGGTDFRPVFDHIEVTGLDPACLIYLTDLEGTFPDGAPLYPVLWIRTEGGARDPGFGEVVDL